MEEQADNDVLHVEVSSGTNTLWKGDALSISTENSEGPFDILPQHANFITLIKEKTITVLDTEHNEKKYAFKQAVLYTIENKVRIYGDFNTNIA